MKTAWLVTARLACEGLKSCTCKQELSPAYTLRLKAKRADRALYDGEEPAVVKHAVVVGLVVPDDGSDLFV